MAIVEPGKGRAIIKQNGERLCVTIPSTTRNDLAVGLVLFLLFWALAEILIFRDLLGGRFAHDPTAARAFFMLVFALLFWPVMATLVFQWLLWQLAGEEIIELTPTSLQQRKEIPFFSRSREFAVADISNLKLTPPPPWFQRFGYRIPGLDFKDGAISFDHKRGVQYLGTELDEADARYVIGEMCKRVKSLAVVPDQDAG